MEEKILSEKEKMQDELAREILALSRNILLVNFRFLDGAVSLLRWHRMEEGTVMTDGNYLFYRPAHVLREFKFEKETCARNYFHSVMHCVFRHMFCSPTVDHQIWDLACDVAVENVISELAVRSVSARRESWQKKLLDELKQKGVGLTAEKLYHHFMEEGLTPLQATELRAAFLGDDHRVWYMTEGEKAEEFGLSGNKGEGDGKGKGEGEEDGNGNGNADGSGTSPANGDSSEENWKKVSERMQMDLEAFGKRRGDTAGGMMLNLKAVNREKYDYSSFLKKFAVMGEVMKINDDEFDQIFYTYGLKLYDKMPLIEPLEYKDVKRIREFVIAIDTSGSVAGDEVQSFVQKTYNILKSTESFFQKINLHILQCDAQIQEHVKITCQKDFDEYLKTMKLHGFGGTDFRPVFQKVEELIRDREFSNLKGLIYFTDGYGVFPEKKPDYETAFVFVRDNYEIPEVPPWAIKLILEKEDL